ncbi:MAG: glycosyltransferase [Candidatus Dormibacteraeota bacterium]|uniref:Glycosyltransferase n=1 Tax=Candidatus Amunia macphersoniae TaxID=3127014 RepID=A0A934KKK6_9BACT|nr:glycosyltransferase [Candidatus Dormibacteraeota bacterium]
MGGEPIRDLVVFSHLRWDGVWQRPHHLVSRLANRFRRTWFAEEPVQRAEDGVRLRCESAGPVTRVLVDVATSTRWPTFGEPADLDHGALVAAACAAPSDPVVWLYSPMALPMARQLQPSVLVYDVMDDLTSFKGAVPESRLRHSQALAEADLVFTGGRSIHERVMEHRRRPSRTLCFPSGVEVDHFAHQPIPHPRPVAGYVGVIDERLDLGLIADLARKLPGWTIRMVGPVAKIDREMLPVAPNIEYLGQRSYADLPAIMAGFDVALMPFALNDATASISPTKTLEYLAAGLPTVSTRIRDVVRDHTSVVAFADDAGGFAQLCADVRVGRWRFPAERVTAILLAHQWDAIAASMFELIVEAGDVRRGDIVAS